MHIKDGPKAICSATSTNAISSGTPVGVSGGSTDVDTLGGFSAGVYTVKRAMRGMIVSAAATVGGAGSFVLYRGGSAYRVMGQNQGGAGSIAGTIFVPNLAANETLEVRHSAGGVTANPAWVSFVEV